MWHVATQLLRPVTLGRMDSDRNTAANTGFKRRLVWTMLAVALAAIAASGRVDAIGESYASDALTRALVTFAIARALNGVVSTAQGTEVSLEPGGIGVNFSVGEMLDPINDLVERFSVVMLVATSSLGLQSLLLTIMGSWAINVVLIALAGAVVASAWIPAVGGLGAAALRRSLIVVALVRFAIPVLMIISTVVFDGFLAERHAADTQVLEATSQELQRFNDETAATDADSPSLIERLGGIVGRLDARQRLEALRDRAAQAAERIVDLIVIFVFQTIVLPLVFLWLLIEIAKALVARTTAL